jgi:hypothetical protein
MVVILSVAVWFGTVAGRACESGATPDGVIVPDDPELEQAAKSAAIARADNVLTTS